MGSSDNKHIQFFKVFLSKRSSQSLILPPAFEEKIPGELPSRVFLKDRNRSKNWLVEVAKINGRLYFQDGWSKFVLENSLTSGEFMVFKYSGHRIFDVMILGRHGCQKEFVEVDDTKELADEEDEHHQDENEDEDEDEEEEEEEEAMHYTMSRNISSKKNLSKHIANSDDEDDNDEDESDDEDEDFVPTRKFRRL